jgi:hypothetical protein
MSPPRKFPSCKKKKKESLSTAWSQSATQPSQAISNFAQKVARFSNNITGWLFFTQKITNWLTPYALSFSCCGFNFESLLVFNLALGFNLWRTICRWCCDSRLGGQSDR